MVVVKMIDFGVGVPTVGEAVVPPACTRPRKILASGLLLETGLLLVLEETDESPAFSAC